MGGSGGGDAEAEAGDAVLALALLPGTVGGDVPHAPRKTNRSTVAELLIGFFKFYSAFDIDVDCVDTVTGHLIPKRTTHPSVNLALREHAQLTFPLCNSHTRTTQSQASPASNASLPSNAPHASGAPFGALCPGSDQR